MSKKKGFSAPKATTTTSSGSATGDDEEFAVTRVFQVMYTKASAKKRKSWEDGVIVLDGKYALLFNGDGKQLAR